MKVDILPREKQGTLTPNFLLILLFFLPTKNVICLPRYRHGKTRLKSLQHCNEVWIDIKLALGVWSYSKFKKNIISKFGLSWFPFMLSYWESAAHQKHFAKSMIPIYRSWGLVSVILSIQQILKGGYPCHCPDLISVS